MSTIISFLPDDNKNILKDKGSKNYKMTEIRPPSIPSNRERIINVKKKLKYNSNNCI